MKLLLEKNTVYKGEELNFKLMLDDEFADELKKDAHIQKYVLNVSVIKGTELKSTDIARKIKSILAEYFLNPNGHKRILYVPTVCDVNIYGEGYIDVFYPLEYKHDKFDKWFETDEEIGKTLLSIHLDDPSETTNVIKIELISIFLVDESYNMQTLWELDNGKVYNFLLDEISTIMLEFAE